MSASKSQSHIMLYLIQIASALAGIGLSLYLLIQHTRLTSGIQGRASFCSFGKLADCDVVNASQYSEILGIPLAGLGALFYFVLLILAIIGPPKSPQFIRTQQILAWSAIFGLGMDFFLLVIQIISIKSLCSMCLLTYIANFSILLCSIRMGTKRFRGWFKETKKQTFSISDLPATLSSAHYAGTYQYHKLFSRHITSARLSETELKNLLHD